VDFSCIWKKTRESTFENVAKPYVQVPSLKRTAPLNFQEMKNVSESAVQRKQRRNNGSEKWRLQWTIKKEIDFCILNSCECIFCMTTPGAEGQSDRSPPSYARHVKGWHCIYRNYKTNMRFSENVRKISVSVRERHMLYRYTHQQIDLTNSPVSWATTAT